MNDRRPTMKHVISGDGTPIAYERSGSGSPLIVIGGAMCDRELTAPTAAALADRGYEVINFDRRGRGASGDGASYSIEQEIGDLAALAALAEGPVAAYAHSSGAGLALHAASRGVLSGPLVLHEAPYNSDAEEMKEESRSWNRRLQDLLAEGRGGDAVAAFMAATGMPEQMVAEMRTTARWEELERMAPTLAYDAVVMGDANGATVPRQAAARVRNPALILSGDAGPDWMLSVARELAEALPSAKLEVLGGEGHVVEPDRLAPVVDAFLRDKARG